MQEQVKKFLNSDLTEKEFYSLEEENVITIKNYLNQLKEKDSEFQNAIKEQYKSIKEKCSWLKDIRFDGLINEQNLYVITSITLYSKDNINLITKYNESEGKFKDISENIPKIYLLNKKIKKHQSRINELDLIQEELREIEHMARNIYKDYLKPISSISSNFNLYYSPREGLSVYNEFDLIALYSDNIEKTKEKEYFVDADSKEKLKNRILIKQNKNNQN